MAEGELSKYSINIAIEVVEYYKWLTTEKKEYIMSKQLLRSGTSIGANVHEGNYASSRADFCAKMQIALKETAETEYWITILEKTGYYETRYDPLKEHLLSVKRMLIATLNKVKGNE